MDAPGKGFKVVTTINTLSWTSSGIWKFSEIFFKAENIEILNENLAECVLLNVFETPLYSLKRPLTRSASDPLRRSLAHVMRHQNVE